MKILKILPNLEDKKLFNVYLFLFALITLLPIPFLAKLKISLPGFTFAPFHAVFTVLITALTLSKIRSAKEPLPQLIRPWIGLLIMLAAGLPFSGHRGESFETAVRFAVQGLFAAWFLQLAATPENLPKFARYVMIFVCLAAVVGLLEKILSPHFFYHDIYMYAYAEAARIFHLRGKGIMGTLGHPVPFGIFLSLFVPLGLAAPFKLKSKIALMTAILLALLICQSRAGALSALIGASIYIVMTHESGAKIRDKFKIIALVALLSGLTLLLLRNFYGGRYKSGLETEGHRLGNYVAGVEMIKKHPFFGIGLGTYPAHFKKFLQPGMQHDVETPDNQHLRIAMETGLVGLAAYLFFCAGFVGRFRRITRSPKFRAAKEIYSACMAGWIAGFVAFLFLDGYYWVPIQFWFWSMAGIILSAASYEGRGIEEPVPSQEGKGK